VRIDGVQRRNEAIAGLTLEALGPIMLQVGLQKDTSLA